MTNEEVGNVVSPFFHKSAPEAAANALVKEAHKRWKNVINNLKITDNIGRGCN